MRPLHAPRRRPHSAIVAAGFLALAGLVAGCAAPAEAPKAEARPVATMAPPTEPPIVVPALHRSGTVAVSPAAAAADIRPDVPVTVKATFGRLESVRLLDRADEAAPGVPGQLSPDGLTWTATSALKPATRYVVVSRIVGDPGTAVREYRSPFTTLTPAALLKASIDPLQGETVGVGMPLIVNFTAPIPVGKRAEIQKRMTVTTSVPVNGAWNWTGASSVRWRPETYWPSGTQVRLSVPLLGVENGQGAWGVADRVIDFRIGRSIISTVDAATHTMSVAVDGQVVRTVPVTSGKPGFLTRSGTKVIMAKHRTIQMDASTTGINEGDPEYYNLQVDYALRITNSGEFVHAAPWSAASHGQANVSHGCVGMGMANAAWFYGISSRGDIVNVVNTGRGLGAWNGWTDWNIPWSTWVQGSATGA